MKTWMMIVAVAIGCGGGKDEPAASGEGGSTEKAAPPAPPTARDGLVDAWKKAGLKPSAMASATLPIGKDCQTGTVNDVEVALCLFASPADAKAAEKPGLEWVGSTTGAAWASGTVVVAVADRKKSDPNGKTINQMMKLAPK